MMICAECGTENPETARFCNGCAAPLTPLETAPTQRKVVTVLFCDVTGSTSLGEQLDPEALRACDGRLLRDAPAPRSSGTAARSRSSSATQ